MSREETYVLRRTVAFSVITFLPAAYILISAWYVPELAEALGLSPAWVQIGLHVIVAASMLLQTLFFLPISTQLLLEMRQRRQLQRELLSAVDQEQQRFGSEIHDGLLQVLAGARLFCRSAQKRLARGEALDTAVWATQSGLLDEATQEAQRMCRALHPVILEQKGLRAALEQQAELATSTGRIACTVVADGDPPVLEMQKAAHLFRIAQEALRNAMRHSGATHVWIYLRHRSGRLELVVEDDGVGIPDAQSHSRIGLGLRTMQHRASVIGGTLRIMPRHPTGTTVLARLDNLELSALDVPI